MFSLSYLPTAERLTVVVVKARNLHFQNSDKVIGDPFVKVIKTIGRIRGFPCACNSVPLGLSNASG